MNFKHWVFNEKPAISGAMRYAGPLVKKCREVLLPRSIGFHRGWANSHGSVRGSSGFGKSCSLWIQTA